MLRGDDGQLYVDICAHRDFVRGEEVLLPYGLETSADLLCSHGIVLEHNDADYVPVYSDAVELVGDVVSYSVAEHTFSVLHPSWPGASWNSVMPSQLLHAPWPPVAAYLPATQFEQDMPTPAGLNWPAGRVSSR